MYVQEYLLICVIDLKALINLCRSKHILAVEKKILIVYNLIIHQKLLNYTNLHIASTP